MGLKPKLYSLVAAGNLAFAVFDNKRYIHTDIINMRAFGHKILREDKFFREIGHNSDWGELKVEGSQPRTDNVGAELQKILKALAGYNVDIITIPDQGLFQRQYSHAELETRIVDLDRLSEQAYSERKQEIECPYLDTEAQKTDESDPEEPRPPKRRVL